MFIGADYTSQILIDYDWYNPHPYQRTTRNKKNFIHMRNHLKGRIYLVGGYRIVFFTISSIWKKQVVIKTIHPCTFQMSRKSLPIKLLILLKWISHVVRQKIYAKATHEFFKIKPSTNFSQYSISNQTVDDKNHHLSKFATVLSQQQPYQKPTIFEKYEKKITWLSTITPVDYQLSTKTTRDHEDDGIMETI